MFVSFNNLSFKKYHKLKFKLKKCEEKFFYPKFCNMGIKLMKSIRINQIQIEAIRKTIRRFFKKNVYIKINLLLFLPISKKPISSRMGKGKGKFERWTAPLQKGKVFYEIFSFEREKNTYKYYKLILKKINNKVPVKLCLTKIKY